MTLDISTADAVQDVLKRFPTGGFLLTASHGLSRNGMLVNRVQQASNVPPTLLISVQKGQPLSPLIRDRRAFAICEIAKSDLLINRLFETPRELHGEDPFLGLPVIETTLGLPVPRCVASWLECELVRHLDIEADYEIYIGRIVGGGVNESFLEKTPATAKKTKKKRRGTDAGKTGTTRSTARKSRARSSRTPATV